MTTPAAKEKKTPMIKRILVRCPATAKLTATGLTIDEDLYADTPLKNHKLTCPHCQQVHASTKKRRPRAVTTGAPPKRVTGSASRGQRSALTLPKLLQFHCLCLGQEGARTVYDSRL